MQMADMGEERKGTRDGKKKKDTLEAEKKNHTRGRTNDTGQIHSFDFMATERLYTPLFPERWCWLLALLEQPFHLFIRQAGPSISAHV